MEKIKESWIRLYFLSFIAFLILYSLLYFEELNMNDLEIVILSVLVTSIIVIFVNLTKKYKNDGIYFSEYGMTYILKHKKYTQNWENLNITRKIDLKYLSQLDINISDSQNIVFSLVIYWPTEIDIIAKTKKYCPKDHELYLAVEKYAKNRGLPF